MKTASRILFLSLVIASGSIISADDSHEKHHTAPSKAAPVVKKAPKAKPAHADHNPKHGGQFFMAPNKFHHLEGALVSESEFRVYFYDNHTKPISAAPFRDKSKMEVQRVDVNGRETGSPVSLTVTAEPTGAYLKAAIPADMKLPLYFTTWLTFPNQKEADLFNFSFDKVSVDKAAKAAPKLTMYQCPMQDSAPQDKPGKCPKCGMNMEPVQN